MSITVINSRTISRLLNKNIPQDSDRLRRNFIIQEYKGTIEVSANNPSDTHLLVQAAAVVRNAGIEIATVRPNYFIVNASK